MNSFQVFRVSLQIVKKAYIAQASCTLPCVYIYGIRIMLLTQFSLKIACHILLFRFYNKFNFASVFTKRFNSENNFCYTGLIRVTINK